MTFRTMKTAPIPTITMRAITIRARVVTPDDSVSKAFHSSLQIDCIQRSRAIRDAYSRFILNSQNRPASLLEYGPALSAHKWRIIPYWLDWTAQYSFRDKKLLYLLIVVCSQPSIFYSHSTNFVIPSKICLKHITLPNKSESYYLKCLGIYLGY